MIEIIQVENTVLRQVAQKVPVKDIRSTKIKKILSDMTKALESQEDGVALAAPQVGVSLRIFIVGPRAFSVTESKSGSLREPVPKDSEQVYINPEIIKRSKKQQNLEEGCLSVRPKYGQIQRATKVTVRAYNKKGERFERGASGLLAQIFQHEIDHLDGILFIDKAKDVRDIIELNGS